MYLEIKNDNGFSVVKMFLSCKSVWMLCMVRLYIASSNIYNVFGLLMYSESLFATNI